MSYTILIPIFDLIIPTENCKPKVGITITAIIPSSLMPKSLSLFPYFCSTKRSIPRYSLIIFSSLFAFIQYVRI